METAGKPEPGSLYLSVDSAQELLLRSKLTVSFASSLGSGTESRRRVKRCVQRN